ncbi:hypothetical protein BDN71DRAFT_1434733 [Pleurotus eryngii]|uniref:G domain-containing protein n=1 Tax=Pleurotus eryngii TaxID=5323 RepID=A0A9P6DC51_PLEER|nr:hypothetical protein BDN71DRAFT_1434733 [Pleurotus eryngii]
MSSHAPWSTNEPPTTEVKSACASSYSSPKTSFRELEPDASGPDEVVIAVMGATGSGKTTFINTASGSALRVGSGLMSCTSAVQASKPFPFDGRTIRLIDTPGFDDTTRTDTDVLTMIAAFLSSTYQHGVKLSGVIYIHRISDFRMGGTSTRNFRMFRELCGDPTLRNVVIVTNMWGEVSLDVGQAREEELKNRDIFFKPVLGKGAQMKRHDNTFDSACTIMRCIAFKASLALRIQRELVDEEKDITETAAGAELCRELHEQAMRYKAEQRQLQDEMKKGIFSSFFNSSFALKAYPQALRQKDEQGREELEEATAQLNRDMMRVQNESQRLASSYAEEKERLEKRMQDLEATSRLEIERQAVEHERRMDEVTDRLRRTQEMDSIERMQLKATVQRLQQQHAEAARRPSRRGLFASIGDIDFTYLSAATCIVIHQCKEFAGSRFGAYCIGQLCIHIAASLVGDTREVKLCKEYPPLLAQVTDLMDRGLYLFLVLRREVNEEKERHFKLQA